MFKRKNIAKKALSIVVAVAMLFTAFPAMTGFSYASTNTLTGLKFEENGQKFNSDDDLKIYFDLDGLDYYPSTDDVELDVTVNGQNYTVHPNHQLNS